MEMNTKYFGRLPFLQEEAIIFQEGLFGFEHAKNFILIRFESENDSLLSLQNIEEEGLAFIVINPFAFMPDYMPHLSDKEIQSLGASSQEELAFYNICVLNDDISKSTVNLKCPLIVNPNTRQAKQLILDDPDYPFKFPFSGFNKKEG